MSIKVRPLALLDHDAWLGLWRGYLSFYNKDLAEEVTALTWSRLLDPDEPMHGAVAVSAYDPTQLGLVHWLTHRSTWAATCYAYLEDLFVAPNARKGGVGRALIEYVYQTAREAGCAQVYWLTHETNSAAMVLYDQVATKTGFVHYAKVLD